MAAFVRVSAMRKKHVEIPAYFIYKKELIKNKVDGGSHR
jgi:hypothetical protein